MHGSGGAVDTVDPPLETVAAAAAELGADDLRSDALALAERLAQGRFYVACVGQVKRGKSTLLNALLGREVLPTALLPVTAVPTVLRYGDHLAARARLASADWTPIDPAALAHYVAEDMNPCNAKRVQAVEVFVPSPLLAGGMCLVDTPGLGSVFEWNAEATRAFVPHIDAAIIVIGADPPLAREELDLVADVARHTRDLVFVLNKADRHPAAEREQAIAFAERVLRERLSRDIEPILAVSALDHARGAHADDAWSDLVSRLERLSTESGRALVRDAEQRATARLADRCLREIDAARDALARPLDQARLRLEALRRAIADVAHQSLRLGHLFAAEQEQLDRLFERERTAFVAAAFPEAKRALDAPLVTIADRWGPRARRRALDAAQEVARSYILPWLGEQKKLAETKYREVANGFVEAANRFLAEIATSGVPGLERLPHALEPEVAFRAKSGFYFTEMLDLAHSVSPGRWLLDAIRPPGLQGRAVARAADVYLDRLFEVNSSRVQNDMRLRVFESRRLLEFEVHALLQTLYASAERALERAREAHAQGTNAVAAHLERLAHLRETVIAR
jgi:predicted GTPase